MAAEHPAARRSRGKPSWGRHRGFYGWAPIWERLDARWRLARAHNYGRVRSAWTILRAELRA